LALGLQSSFNECANAGEVTNFILAAMAMLEEKDPSQAVAGSGEDAVRLGCVGIGFTIYPAAPRARG
jgi:hypothetical protein